VISAAGAKARAAEHPCDAEVVGPGLADQLDEALLGRGVGQPPHPHQRGARVLDQCVIGVSTSASGSSVAAAADPQLQHGSRRCRDGNRVSETVSPWCTPRDRGADCDCWGRGVQTAARLMLDALRGESTSTRRPLAG
jgi:hypothetical protein